MLDNKSARRMEVLITFGVTPALETLLSKIISPTSSRIEQKLNELEKHMARQDDQITAFQSETSTQLAALGTSLDSMATSQANIAADEQRILDQLNTLDGLTPANQAKLEAVVSQLTAVVGRSQAQASAFQSLADSLPDTP